MLIPPMVLSSADLQLSGVAVLRGLRWLAMVSLYIFFSLLRYSKYLHFCVTCKAHKSFCPDKFVFTLCCFHMQKNGLVCFTLGRSQTCEFPTCMLKWYSPRRAVPCAFSEHAVQSCSVLSFPILLPKILWLKMPRFEHAWKTRALPWSWLMLLLLCLHGS